MQDISSDPLWDAFRHLALPHGLRACWSQPILGPDGVVLGTFALYYDLPRSPTRAELDLIQLAAHLAGLAIRRQQAEDELRASEEKYRSLVESADASIAMFNAAGHLLYINQIAARALGAEPEALIGSPIEQFFPPPIAQHHLEHIQQVISSEQGQVTESANILQGQERWFRTSVQPVRDASGQVTMGLIFANDITEFKASEKALRQSEERMRGLIQSQTAYVLRTNMQGYHTYWNRKFESEFGWLYAAGGIGHGFALASISEHHHERATEATERCVADPGQIVRVELDTPKQDGGIGTTLWEFICLTDNQGLPHEIQCMGVDISDRKQAELALQEVNARLEQRVIERTTELERTTNRVEAIINHSGDGILLLDVHQGIQQANPAFHALLGQPAQHYLGQPLSAFCQAEGKTSIDAIVAEVAGLHQTRQVEARAVRPDGSQLHMEINLAPVHHAASAVQNIVCILRDVTERRQAQLAIAEEHNLLRTLIDAVPDYIYVKDRHHRMRFNNVAHARSVGFDSPEAMVGKTDHELFDAELAEKFWADEERLFQTGEPILNTEERSLGGDGQIIWALTTKVPLRNLNGELIGLVGITHNVSQLKASEAALRASEARYRLLAENVTDLISRHTPEGNYTFASPSALKLTGYAPEELIGRPAYDFFHPEDVAAITQSHQTIIETPVIYTITYRFRHKAGHYVWLETTSHMIREVGTPAVQEIIAVSRDVSERKATEESLKALSQRLALATLAGNIGVWDWNLRDDSLFWDERMLGIFGMPAQDFDGTIQTWQQVIHPEDGPTLHPLVREAITNGQPFEGEFRAVRPDGQIRHIKAHGLVLLGADGVAERMVGASMDITAVKEAEQTLRLALEKEKEVSELKSRFVSTASHEFRTPLATILATTETLTLYRDRMDADQVAIRLDRIRQQVLRMKAMMDDVLNLARMQAHRVAFQPGPGNLDQLCQAILEEFQSQDEYRDRIHYHNALSGAPCGLTTT
ncbi:MAG: PAS domain S-box protein [Anaerolineae bacterium]|nr:PAS domain S-box protein [Anaerolineae bacterium]